MQEINNDKKFSSNYIKIVNWFWDKAPYIDGFKASHIAVFFAIVDSINRNKWAKTSLPYDYIINKCKIGKLVYLECRQWLYKNGLIEMSAGKNAYQMASFSIPAVLNDTATDTATRPLLVPLPVPLLIPLTAPIIKHKTYKHKNTNTKELNYSFEQFWNLYDKKKGSIEKIKKKWESLTDDQRKKAIEHIPLYKKEQPDKKYRKHPEGYLNNNLFNDETIIDNASGQSNQEYQLQRQKREERTRKLASE